MTNTVRKYGDKQEQILLENMEINRNKYIQKIVERLVEVPHFLREIEIVKEMHEKNIPGP